MHFVVCWFLFKILFSSFFSKKSFRNNTIRASIRWIQIRQNVGPDLCPNCLQLLSADDTSKLELKHGFRKDKLFVPFNWNTLSFSLDIRQATLLHAWYLSWKPPKNKQKLVVINSKRVPNYSLRCLLSVLLTTRTCHCHPFWTGTGLHD